MRSGFGSTAIAALEEHFEKAGKKTNMERQTEAKRLVDDQRYLFGIYTQSETGKVSIIIEHL
jgi:hypothetical protein